MTLNNEQLRLGIIEKLKECNAYIDNELPDYIMVMLVNKKTFHQITNDLKLFLGEHTTLFIDWLQEAVTSGNINTGKKKTTTTTDVIEKEQSVKKSDSNKVTDTATDDGVECIKNEKDSSTNEASAKQSGNKRRKSEDELELHPTLDWEEEREEGGGKGSSGDRGTTRGRSYHRRSNESKISSRRSGEDSKIGRTTTGDRGGSEGRGRERRREGGRTLVEGEKEDSIKQTRPVKLSKSDDLRVLIARKKGERSAPPTYATSRRYSHSGSEGESGEEEDDVEREGEKEDGRRKGGMSSVVKVPERTHLLIEGGSRLLARAIKGLAAPAQRKQQQHTSEERGRRGGRDERERREGAGGQGEKRKVRDSHASVQRVKRVAVESLKEEGRREGEREDKKEEGIREGEREDKKEEDGEKEQVDEDLEGDILPLSIKKVSEAMPEEEEEEEEKFDSTADDTSRKVELAVITALRKVLPGQKELTDLRHLITRQRQKTDDKQETQFVITMDGLDERYEIAEEREHKNDGRGGGGGGGNKMQEGEVPSRSGMPERCRFWPNCKKADSCPYHHPSAQCRTFPNCKYGNKCLFIHPQCKFDSRCTRSDCPYLHTAPRHILPRATVPTPSAYAPPSFPSPVMKFPPPNMWSPHTKSRFPNKSALTWTPTKHISQRSFAVPDEETTSMTV